jgi:hypothetical protein
LEQIERPWSDEQVAKLNAYQRAGRFHPFTCGNDRSDEAHQKYADRHNEPDLGLLVATNDGWRCPVPGCGYTQTWAHAFMAQELPPDPIAGLRVLDDIRKAVIEHMGAPDEVSLEPVLEAMAAIEPGDTPAGWLVLGTIRYFFFLKRWRLDDPAYQVVLEKFFAPSATSWFTSAQYQIQTAAAISAWYKYDLPAVVVQEPEERKVAKAPAKKKKTPVKYQAPEGQPSRIKQTKAEGPKDDGLEKRMAKRIATQRG